MSGFTGEWLALREPADIAARSQELTSFVRDALESRARLEIVDLGSGTGSNVRYLAPRLPSPQHWTSRPRFPWSSGSQRPWPGSGSSSRTPSAVRAEARR